jgi:hypothetical protein
MVANALKMGKSALFGPQKPKKTKKKLFLFAYYGINV